MLFSTVVKYTNFYKNMLDVSFCWIWKTCLLKYGKILHSISLVSSLSPALTLSSTCTQCYNEPEITGSCLYAVHSAVSSTNCVSFIITKDYSPQILAPKTNFTQFCTLAAMAPSFEYDEVCIFSMHVVVYYNDTCCAVV